MVEQRVESLDWLDFTIAKTEAELDAMLNETESQRGSLVHVAQRLTNLRRAFDGYLRWCSKTHHRTAQDFSVAVQEVIAYSKTLERLESKMEHLLKGDDDAEA